MLEPVIHYTGNKFKRLPQILPKIPQGHCIVEPFAGSGVVGFNAVDAGLMKSFWYNEIDKNLFDLMFYMVTTPSFISEVEKMNLIYEPTEDGYMKLRSDYNAIANSNHRDSVNFAMLYLLTCRSFNNQFRFNKSGRFNLPFGKRNYVRMEGLKRVKKMYDEGKSFCFTSDDFEVTLNKVGDDDFVFIDPPYSTTTATYNSSWTKEDDDRMYKALDRLTYRGVKWMMTNVLENRNKINQDFLNFIHQCRDSLTTETLNGTFNNSSYYKSSGKTVELLVTNY